MKLVNRAFKTTVGRQKASPSIDSYYLMCLLRRNYHSPMNIYTRNMFKPYGVTDRVGVSVCVCVCVCVKTDTE